MGTKVPSGSRWIQVLNQTKTKHFSMYLLSQSSGSPLLRKLYFQNVKINCTWDKNPPQTRGLLCAERGVFCLTSALLFIGFSGCNFPLWLLFPTSHTNSRRCLCLCVSSSVLWCPPLAPGTVPGLGGGAGSRVGCGKAPGLGGQQTRRGFLQASEGAESKHLSDSQGRCESLRFLGCDVCC